MYISSRRLISTDASTIGSDLFVLPSNYIHVDIHTLQEIALVFKYFKVSTIGVNKTIKNLGNRCVELIHGRALELLDPTLLMTTANLLS